MDSGLILTALFLGIAAAYPLRSLMLFERETHEGPFPSDMAKRYVRFHTSGHTQRVALFDWIRRLFGVYQVNELGEWVVYEHYTQVERWTCPFCLSFWICLPFSLGLTFHRFGLAASFLVWFIPIHCFIAIVAQLVYRVLWD